MGRRSSPVPLEDWLRLGSRGRGSLRAREDLRRFINVRLGDTANCRGLTSEALLATAPPIRNSQCAADVALVDQPSLIMTCSMPLKSGDVVPGAICKCSVPSARSLSFAGRRRSGASASHVRSS